MAKKRAFVRYSKQGKIVPGSLILTAGSYPNGPSIWKEVSADLCCNDILCTPANYGDWKLVTGGVAGDGVVLVDHLEDCPTYTFVGPNDDDDDGWVYLTKYFPSTTCLEIGYEWTSFDDGAGSPPDVDWPVYWNSSTQPTGIPGDLTVRVSDTPDNGTWNVTVSAGQWFSIGIYSSDSCCGRGFLTAEICEVECLTTTTTTVAPTTTTTTTLIIPPGAVPVQFLIGYETISPVEDIVVSNTLEDICLFVNNFINNNITPDSFIVDETTYYFDPETDILYNSVTNTFAEDGYYVTEGFFQVIDGVVQIIDPYEICGITTTTTTTELI